MIIVITVVIYLIYIIIFQLLFFRKKESFDENELKISLIVAAKNEEQNLPKLIQSIFDQNYRSENYEVIIVDDNSTDLTYSTVKNFIEGRTNFKVLKAEKKEFLGKRGALQIGIDESKFQYLLFTDADCELSPGFLKSYSNQFSANKDLVFGISPLYQHDTILNKLICYDNLWVHILSFSFANLGLPYSASGRSLGINKDSFYKIEGYANTLNTLSGDDDLLLREAVSKGLSVGLVMKGDAFVFSNGKENLKEFILQKSRHTSTSNYYSIKIKFILGFWHLLNLIMLFSPLLISFNNILILLIIIKIIFELITVKLLMKKFGYLFSSIEILGLLIYREMLLVIFYFTSFFRKFKW